MVTVTGELDLATIGQLHDAVAEGLALATGSADGALVLDMSGVALADPVVFGVLLAARARCGATGTSLSLVAAPDGPVVRSLARCGIDRLFTVAGSVSQALGQGF